LVILHCLTLSI